MITLKKISLLFIISGIFSIIICYEIIDLNELDYFFTNNALQKSENFRIVDDTDLYMKIEFVLPESEFILNEVFGEEYLRIYNPEAGYLMEKGFPELPVFTTLVALPDFGHVQIEEVLEKDILIIDRVEIFPSQGLSIEICNQSGFKQNTDFYRSREIYPTSSVILGNPDVMRDFRVVPVTFQPFSYSPSEKKLTVRQKIEIKIGYEFSRNVDNNFDSRKIISRSFERSYRSLIVNYDNFIPRNIDYQKPSMLIIYPDTSNSQFLSIVNNFVDWKRRKGFYIQSSSTSGMNSNIQIKNFIQDAYETWEHPPEFVVLMGAESGMFSVPGWSMGNPAGRGDHNYTILTGDILSDVFIGRFPVTSAYQLQTMWNKQVSYEIYPYMSDTSWYNRAVISAHESTQSGVSIVYLSRYIRDQMLTYNPDYDITVINTGEVYSQIINAFNQGVMNFTFRGLMMTGWNPEEANNGFMLPSCFLVTCYTYDHAVSTVLAGTPTTPKGGINAVGLSTGSTKTAFNNILTAGFHYGMFVDGARKIGEIHNLGKLYMYNLYSNAHYDEMTNFFHWSNLFGDPSLSVWVSEPKVLNVEYPDEIYYGANYIEIFVNDEQGLPVENARVTVRKVIEDEEVIFESDYSDANGIVTLFFESIVGEIDITAVKDDFHPYLGVFTILEEGSVGFDEIIFGSELSAGSTGDFVIVLKNYSDEAIYNLTGILTTDSSYLSVIDGYSGFTILEPNQTGYNTQPFTVDVSFSAPDFYKARFDLELTDGSNEWIVIVKTFINGSKLEITQILYDQSEIINPGDTVNMEITLANNGSIDLSNVYAELYSSNDYFLINQQLAHYGDIDAGDEVIPWGQSYNVTAMVHLLPGMVIPLQINIYNDEGFQKTVNFFVEVGLPQVTDPLGPDAYGYWCYDDGDLDYIDSPVYDWIEIAATMGGPGIDTGLTADFNNNQGVMTMDLPFTFRFYGVDYDQISICANGWISFGYVDYASQRNGRLPGPLGPMPIIAAFWDNLSLVAGGVYTYFNQEENIFIIQWQNTQNVVSNAENTFQVILYDPTYYPIFNGNGPIKIQYKVFNNLNNAGSHPHGNWGKYCTIGIADHTNTVGLEYTFNNEYPTAARPLTDESAIFFTGPPIIHEHDYLVISQVNIHDENNYGIVYEDCTIGLNFVIFNHGQSASENITGLISSTSEDVLIINAFSEFTDIPSGLSGMNIDYLSFLVTSDIDENQLLPFTLFLESNTGSWEYSFDLTVEKPKLQMTSFSFNDSMGNNDGIADPGETIELVVNLNNSSNLPVENISVEINYESNLIDIPQNNFQIPFLQSGLNSQAVFEATLSTAIPPESSIVLNISITADSVQEINKVVSLGIGITSGIIEESFSQWLPQGWSIDQHSQNWSQSNTNYAGGESPEARFTWLPDFIGVSRLISPPISIMGATNVSLEFKHKVNDFQGGYTLGVSTRSEGTVWTPVWEIEVDASIPAETIAIPITSEDLHNPGFQISWYLSGSSWGINYWYIDDIVVNATVGNSAKIQGNVSLFSSAVEVTEVIVSTPGYGTNPDSYGNYTLYLTPGNYDYLEASLPYHSTPYYVDINVEAGDILPDYDFHLSYLQPATNLTVNSGIGVLELEWDYNVIRRELNQNAREVSYRDEFQYFNVYRQLYTSQFQLIGNTENTSYVDNVEQGKRYSYFIKAQYTTGESLPTETVEIYVESLASPQNLTAEYMQNEGIYLNWDPPNFLRNRRFSLSDREDEIAFLSYRLYKGGELLAEIEDYNATFYLDTEVSIANTYIVTAVYNVGESASSNSAEIFFFMPPKNFSAETGDLEIFLSWDEPEFPFQTDVSDFLLGYNLFRNGTLLNNEYISCLEFVDKQVVNGSLYVYSITAVYLQGESDFSEQLEIMLIGAPTELTANVGDQLVGLSWQAPVLNQTRKDRAFYGYNVYRDDDLINPVIITNTHYFDLNVVNFNTYVYYVTAVYSEAESEPSNSVYAEPVPGNFTHDENLPKITKLISNFPNPFNPITYISFSLKEKSDLQLEIFNLSGQKVSTLISEELEAGYYTVQWDSKDDNGYSVSSGVYFCRMKAGEYYSVRKMILIK